MATPEREPTPTPDEELQQKLHMLTRAGDIWNMSMEIEGVECNVQLQIEDLSKYGAQHAGLMRCYIAAKEKTRDYPVFKGTIQLHGNLLEFEVPESPHKRQFCLLNDERNKAMMHEVLGHFVSKINAILVQLDGAIRKAREGGDRSELDALIMSSDIATTLYPKLHEAQLIQDDVRRAVEAAN